MNYQCKTCNLPLYETTQQFMGDSTPCWKCANGCIWLTLEQCEGFTTVSGCGCCDEYCWDFLDENAKGLYVRTEFCQECGKAYKYAFKGKDGIKRCAECRESHEHTERGR